MLTAQRRHRPPCRRAEWDAGYTKCSCPIVIRGTLNKKHLSISTSRYLPPDKARDIAAARDLALLWERTGTPVRPEHYAPVAPLSESADPQYTTVAVAVAAFMADARDRGQAENTIYKKGLIFERRLISFCENKGIRFVRELDVAALREWRASWELNSLGKAKRQAETLGFIRFCESSGWLPGNFTNEADRGLGTIKVKASQPGYFTAEQYVKVIKATHDYSDRPTVDRAAGTHTGGHRIRAITELMRWTGLRIRDAATLERDRLRFDAQTQMWSVMVYQKKTGDPVYCPIPPDVAELLRTIPDSQKGLMGTKYFFWTGVGKVKSLCANWNRSYSKLFKLAALKEPDGSVKRCHPHMFRDTFAVESLLSGMRLDEVSTILGHSSVKITERHYMPWVRARQDSLNQSVLKSWVKQGKVTPEGIHKVAEKPSRRVRRTA